MNRSRARLARGESCFNLKNHRFITSIKKSVSAIAATTRTKTKMKRQTFVPKEQFHKRLIHENTRQRSRRRRKIPDNICIRDCALGCLPKNFPKLDICAV
jgi:hypothetical protein